MIENEQELGFVPPVTESDLERNISELKSRLDALSMHESAEERAQARVLEVLLRNRRNLIELLKGGRFV